MKLLFIDHEFHRLTGSASFFVEILRRCFNVDEHYYSEFYRTGSERLIKGDDGAVIWEFPISRSRFFFPGKVNVFVPMYDNEWASYWQWKRIAWSGMGVISFCDKVSEHAQRCGVKNLLDVRFFPDPSKLPQSKGDPRRVFLWERGSISRDVAEKLFPPSAGYVFDVKGANEFLPREEYLERLSKCGVVIAPRRKEGIGMAFLEAMAMGKCVAAHNDATMNEYIRDGETGVIFDVDNPAPVKTSAVEQVCENLREASGEYYARWQRDVAQINDFIESQRACAPSFLNRVKLALSYPLYLAEGFLHRFAG